MIVSAGDYLFIPRGSLDHVGSHWRKWVQKVRIKEIKTRSVFDCFTEAVQTKTTIKVYEPTSSYSAWFNIDSIGKTIFTSEEKAFEKLGGMK